MLLHNGRAAQQVLKLAAALLTASAEAASVEACCCFADIEPAAKCIVAAQVVLGTTKLSLVL
jgi:cyclic lactone autoinducer peptide